MYQIQINDWIGDKSGDLEEQATLASISMYVQIDGQRICLTEVLDRNTQTIHEHINVSAYVLARWFLLNWWRLRWEPERRNIDWRMAHTLPGIGYGYAWPPINLSSDGKFVQIQSTTESAFDVASVRYLPSVTAEIPAKDFEQAIDELVDQVCRRLRECRIEDHILMELRDELNAERLDPQIARGYRLQAKAGIDPGEATESWVDQIDAIEQIAGPDAVEELVSALPDMPNGLMDAKSGLEQLQRSEHVINLSRLSRIPMGDDIEQPWQTGERFASAIRQKIGQTTGPISSQRLGDFLDTRIPIDCSHHQSWKLQGGYRNGDLSRVRIAVPRKQEYTQRFYLARVMGSFLLSNQQDHLLPVTSTKTSMQKCERAFAQELLCPWRELESVIDEYRNLETAIDAASEHFEVTEWTIWATLHNKGKIRYEQLPADLR